MKKIAYFTGLGMLALLMSGCRCHQYNAVVKETYVHKYGVPVAKADWDAQGQEGAVIQLRTDGVTVTRNCVNGVLEGETTYTFPNSSTIRYREIYERGILKVKRENFPSGVPMKEEVFDQGELVNLTRWYEDGTPAATETYENGLLITGEYRTPLNIAESKVLEGNGVRLCRSNEGDLLYKDTLKNGELIERVTYFANGDPATITPYVSGMIHGTRLTFLQGGLPHTAEEWISGQQEGLTTSFLNGEKIAESLYTHGKKNGVEFRYKDGKILVEEVSFKEGSQHGLRKIYVDGETKTEYYLNGEVVSRNTYERMNNLR